MTTGTAVITSVTHVTVITAVGVEHFYTVVRTEHGQRQSHCAQYGLFPCPSYSLLFNVYILSLFFPSFLAGYYTLFPFFWVVLYHLAMRLRTLTLLGVRYYFSNPPSDLVVHYLYQCTSCTLTMCGRGKLPPNTGILNMILCS